MERVSVACASRNARVTGRIPVAQAEAGITVKPDLAQKRKDGPPPVSAFLTPDESSYTDPVTHFVGSLFPVHRLPGWVSHSSLALARLGPVQVRRSDGHR
jgi:hypothetical protein